MGVTNWQYPPPEVAEPRFRGRKPYRPGDRVRIKPGLGVDPTQEFAGKVGTVIPRTNFLTQYLGGFWVELDENPDPSVPELILFSDEVDPA